MAEKRVSEAQNGSTVHVSLRDIVLVSLPENPTTGFRWSIVTGGEPVMILTGDDFVMTRDAGVGAGGGRLFRFAANSAGSTTLELKLWRHWEGEASVTDRFTLDIQVA